jgi:hypothetical protein
MRWDASRIIASAEIAILVASGDASSCGDWLAVARHEQCHGEDGFDIEKFERVLRDNGVAWDLDRDKHGWVGRFRMNGRQKLAALARKQGFVVIGGEKVRAPGVKGKRRRKAKTAEAEA